MNRKLILKKMLYEIRKRPFLYDTSSQEFHDNNMKENGSNGIAFLLGTTGMFYTLYITMMNSFLPDPKKISFKLIRAPSLHSCAAIRPIPHHKIVFKFISH